MRLIDADAVLYALVEEGHDNATKYDFRLGDTIKFTPTQVDEIVSRMPTIEPERKKGKWIDAVLPNDSGGLQVQVCDQCNTFFPLAYTGGGHNFCPNCGANMREPENIPMEYLESGGR